MTGPVTFLFYAMLLFGDGQETELRPVSYSRTLAECTTLLEAAKPSVGTVDLGYGLEAVETVYGCEQEGATDYASARADRTDLGAMFEAAQREDMKP